MGKRYMFTVDVLRVKVHHRRGGDIPVGFDRAKHTRNRPFYILQRVFQQSCVDGIFVYYN